MVSKLGSYIEVFAADVESGESAYGLNQTRRTVMALTANSSSSIVLPRNSSWVEVDGLVGPGYGILHIRLQPPADEGSTVVLSLPTSKSFVTSDTFLSIPLNPTITYNLTLWTDAPTAGKGVYLNSTVVIPYDMYVKPMPRTNIQPGTTRLDRRQHRARHALGHND